MKFSASTVSVVLFALLGSSQIQARPLRSTTANEVLARLHQGVVGAKTNAVNSTVVAGAGVAGNSTGVENTGTPGATKGAPLPLEFEAQLTNSSFTAGKKAKAAGVTTGMVFFINRNV